MSLAAQVAAVRRFNRFYTRRIGVLEEGLLDSPYSLTEVRVLYELAHRRRPSAAELVRELGLDPGYLSRLVQKLARAGLVTRTRAGDDARRTLLGLTARGKKVFADLDGRQDAEVERLLAPLSRERRRRLVESLRSAAAALEETPANEPIVLRTHRPGDIGWVVQRHGELYWQEYRYDEQFEALVAEIAARFLQRFDPARERCWIAERNGERVGCVFLVRQRRDIAKLRLLLVEPSARGVGLGQRLVDECVRFARERGYRKIVLWTQSELTSARRLYRAAGFRRVKAEPNPSFGRRLVSETWELAL